MHISRQSAVGTYMVQLSAGLDFKYRNHSLNLSPAIYAQNMSEGEKNNSCSTCTLSEPVSLSELLPQHFPSENTKWPNEKTEPGTVTKPEGCTNEQHGGYLNAQEKKKNT